ncbi:hypothetical protein BJX99DRAFT_228406 [Aspergillus californicus]
MSMPILIARLNPCNISVFRSTRIWTPRIAHRPRGHYPECARFASTRVNGVYDVRVGSYGHVSLSVVAPSVAESEPGNVIIRLPQGPIFRDASTVDGSDGLLRNYSSDRNSISQSKSDTASAQTLADVTSSTVVTINYRLGLSPCDEDNKISSPPKMNDGEASISQSQPEKKMSSSYNYYPTPVHDTLTAFDWVLENLQPARLGVMGKHIGGSLALMLALTEPGSVHAVAAIEPICDWTSLDEYCTLASKRKAQCAPRDLQALLRARGEFFTSAQKYFDPFASPILFLRSAGKDVPRVFPRYLTGVEYPIPVLDVVADESGNVGGNGNGNGGENNAALWDVEENLHDTAETSDPEQQQPVRRRKTLARWPPYGLDYGTSGPKHRYSRGPVEKLEVTLPRVHLFTRQNVDMYMRTGLNTESPSKTDPETSSNAESESESTEPRKHPVPRRRRPRDETVLTHQATEMVEFMRRACFWGRESGVGMERVSLSSLPETGTRATSDRPGDDGRVGAASGKDEVLNEMLHAGNWLVGALDSKLEGDRTSHGES